MYMVYNLGEFPSYYAPMLPASATCSGLVSRTLVVLAKMSWRYKDLVVSCLVRMSWLSWRWRHEGWVATNLSTKSQIVPLLPYPGSSRETNPGLVCRFGRSPLLNQQSPRSPSCCASLWIWRASPSFHRASSDRLPV